MKLIWLNVLSVCHIFYIMLSKLSAHLWLSFKFSGFIVNEKIPELVIFQQLDMIMLLFFIIIVFFGQMQILKNLTDPKLLNGSVCEHSKIRLLESIKNTLLLSTFV